MTMYSAEAPLEEADYDTGGWLEMARDAYETSTDYFDASVRSRVEKALSHFQNKHASGSKYNSEAFKYRAKGFRPKTRSMVRANEAAAVAAFFSTQDVLHVSPENEADEQQRISAEINQELLTYRLERSIPWFTTLVGAYQDAINTGVCISHQFWHYEEIPVPEQVTDGVGQPVMEEDGTPAFQMGSHTLHDKPMIELRPIENIRFSPSADWTDPLSDSPYLIDRFAMHVDDVMMKMSDYQRPWNKLEPDQLRLGAADDRDTVRSVREGKGADSMDLNHAISGFDVVWIHRNIIRKEGRDMLFYTLGTHFMLSEPIPLEQEYRHLKPGERPYVMGFATIESHRVYPTSLNELMAGLQQEANDINNQRRDNVSLVLNRRYYARRGATIDFRSLTRNIPGSVTMMDDINQDIRSEAPPEVTGSAYQEQDRINMDFDELAGSFSQSSVGSNRQLNETVGGMQMLQQSASTLTEYQIRVFAETWVEPVLRQLVRLEQAYETDQTVMAVAAERAKLYMRFGVDEITDAMLAQSLTTRVNVGFGATNPQQRVEKLAMGLNTIGQFAPQVIQSMDSKELVSEVMGALGYRGVERFFPGIAEGEQQNPEVQQMQQQMQEMQQQMQEMQAKLQSREMEVQGRLQQEQIRSQTQLQKANMELEADMRREAIRNEGRVAEIQLKGQMEQQVRQLEAQLGVVDRRLAAEKNQIERGKLQNQREALVFQMRKAEADMMHQARQATQQHKENMLTANPTGRLSQTYMNDEYGMVPGSVG